MEKAFIFRRLNVTPLTFTLPNGSIVRHEIAVINTKPFHRYIWKNCPEWIIDIVPNSCISRSPLDLGTLNQWIMEVENTAHAEKPRP